MHESIVSFQWLSPEQKIDLNLPQYETAGSSGMDIEAGVEESLVIAPGEIQLIPTGLAIAIPEGYEIQVRPRSGLAVKHGITIVNSPGTIDSDYRGEVKIALINLGRTSFTVHRGDRIAQLVLAKVERASFSEATELSATSRGDGGFGHTGV